MIILCTPTFPARKSGVRPAWEDGLWPNLQQPLALLIAVALLLAPLAALHAAEPNVSGSVPPKKDLPLPGEVFLVSGHTAFLIPAKGDLAGEPKGWVWYAPTLPNLPGQERAMDVRAVPRCGHRHRRH